MSVYDHSAYGAEQVYRKMLRKDLRDGILAGVLAGATLIIIFFGYDVLWFRPLATPDFLSGALFGGAEPGVEAISRLRNVRIGIFTILHMVTFAFLGVVFARFFRFTQLRKTLLTGVLYGLIVCTAIVGASMQVTGTQMSVEPGWPALLTGNFVAGLVMVVYLRRAQGVDSSG